MQIEVKSIRLPSIHIYQGDQTCELNIIWNMVERIKESWRVPVCPLLVKSQGIHSREMDSLDERVTPEILQHKFWGPTTRYCTTNFENLPQVTILQIPRTYHRTLHKPLPLHYDTSMAACRIKSTSKQHPREISWHYKGLILEVLHLTWQAFFYPFLLWWTLHFMFSAVRTVK